MRAGRLRFKVTIEQPDETQSSTGGIDKDGWSSFATGVWAGVEPLQGKEIFEADATQPKVTTLVVIRHLEGVTPKMRVLHRSRYLYVQSVINRWERDREMHLMCSEEP